MKLRLLKCLVIVTEISRWCTSSVSVRRAGCQHSPTCEAELPVGERDRHFAYCLSCGHQAQGVDMHHTHPALLLLLLHCLLQSVLSFAPLSLFGSPYLWTSIMYRTHPRAGLFNRQRYKAVFGERGERLIEVLGRGHHPRRQRHLRTPPGPGLYNKVILSISWGRSYQRERWSSYNYFQLVKSGNPVNKEQSRTQSKYLKIKSNSDDFYLFRIFKELFSIFGIK